jgi:ubiquinone/menaquinone biosynthesis C-methylase UbiE
MLKNFVTDLHKSTKRNYLKRMLDNKVHCMNVSKKFKREYWDGNRRYGYGGYKYISSRWHKVAKKIISQYNIKAGSKILDVGCGKGFLLWEMIKIEPNLKIYGFDISKYALKNSFKHKNLKLFYHKAQDKFPFNNKYFDLVISLGALHNLEIADLVRSLEEIERTGKKKYIMLESYRNNKELFNLQCWALTCNSFFSKNEWLWLLKKFKYKGDYEFIYFE